MKLSKRVIAILTRIYGGKKIMTMISTIPFTNVFKFLERFEVVEPFGFPILDLGVLISNGNLFLYYDSEISTELVADTQAHYISFKPLLDKLLMYNSKYDLMDMTRDCMTLISNLKMEYESSL